MSASKRGRRNALLSVHSSRHRGGWDHTSPLRHLKTFACWYKTYRCLAMTSRRWRSIWQSRWTWTTSPSEKKPIASGTPIPYSRPRSSRSSIKIQSARHLTLNARYVVSQRTGYPVLVKTASTCARVWLRKDKDFSKSVSHSCSLLHGQVPVVGEINSN